MKVWVFLSFVFSYSVSMACPDISGDFFCKPDNLENSVSDEGIKVSVRMDTEDGVTSFDIKGYYETYEITPLLHNGQINYVNSKSPEWGDIFAMNYRVQCTNDMAIFDFTYVREFDADSIEFFARDSIYLWGDNHLWIESTESSSHEGSASFGHGRLTCERITE